ncbi:hypothetical protein [Rhodococcus sp. 1139]|uniref:hypothetical protein n=1 Tax=Rhodococcus sp. 1139 TaxID=1833762 RepID=UPI0008727DB4|nr:hypothetical protein [Rhodococcus sp. 1139]OFE09780.1 hypothetical protein A5N83_05865 [Rhodococcus sp. 1139]
MTDTASTPPPRGSVHLRASWWWSRHDDLANLELADIFARHGYPCADMADPEVLDASLRAAVQNDDALAELAEWIETTSTRRGGSGIQNLRHSIGGFTDYLTRKLDEKPMTAKTLRECAQQIGFTNDTIREGSHLPELAHPDEEMTELLRRYNDACCAILVAAATEE